MTSEINEFKSREWIEATAGVWLSHRDRGMSASETADFIRWLQHDPQHARTFAELDRTWRQFDRLAGFAGAENRASAAGALSSPRRSSRRQGHPYQWIAVAAAVAVLLLGYLHVSSPSITAETAVGGYQRLVFPDGSIAQLNTDSAIGSTFTATERRVQIVRGEVHFTVNKDPSRPFIVEVGPIAVRAVGTAFNVRRSDRAVEVLVTEGRVTVDEAKSGRSLLESKGPILEPLLEAGERAVITVRPAESKPPPATIGKVTVSDVQRALAWQERRLEFGSSPLEEVVREFNRYNQQQLRIANPRLAKKEFSGSFRADGYEALVRLLEADFGVTAIRSEREIVLISRH